MDLSNLLAGLGGAEGGIDPAKLVGGVQEVFASQGGVDGLLAKLRAGGLGRQSTRGSRPGRTSRSSRRSSAPRSGPTRVKPARRRRRASRSRRSCRCWRRSCR